MTIRSPSLVACIAAHPDDEVLVAGGSLFRHASEGCRVRSLILASGLDSRGPASEAEHDKLARCAAAAADKLGSEPPTLERLPDNRLDTIALLDIVQTVERFLADFPADIIYTHHRGDLNIDHRIVHDAVVTATRPIPGAPTPCVFAGEVLSSSEWQSPQMAPFQPQHFVTLTGEALTAKAEALSAYADEVRDAPHPRSVAGIATLARLRGMACGFDAADAFMLVRNVLA